MQIFLLIIFFFKIINFLVLLIFIFPCNDFYAFEIAICFNALCFDGIKENLSLMLPRLKNLLMVTMKLEK